MVILPLVLLGISAWASWRTQWQNATADMVRSADAGAEYVARYLQGYNFALGRVDDLIKGLSDAEILLREGQLHAALERMIGELPQAEAAFVIDRNGYPLLGANIYPIPKGVPTAVDRDFFLALSGPTPPPFHVSQVYRNKWNGIPFFALSRRRELSRNGQPSGGFDGLINVLVSPERLSEGLHYLLNEPGEAISLVRDDGVLVTRTPPPPAGVLPAYKPMPAGVQREIIPDMVSTNDGARVLAVHRRVEGFPLYIAARRTREAIVDAWWRDQRLLLGFGLPVTFALFLLSLRVTHDRVRLSRALIESESWLQRTVDDGGIGFWEYRGAGQPIIASPKLLALLGIAPGETELTPEAALQRIRPEARAELERMIERAFADGHAAIEFPIDRPRPGQALELAWLASKATRVSGKPRHLVGITYDITARRIAESRVNDLLHRTVEEREAERLQIARDLHDGLGQQLALLHYDLAELPQGDAPVARLRSTLAAIGEETRRIAQKLRPTAIDDLGLATALRHLVEEWSAHCGIKTEIDLRLPAERPPLPVEITIYRIVQEALTNVARHAAASRVGITIGVSDDHLRLVIDDDGRGMPASIPQGRLGLKGIEERLSLIGGTLEIEGAPGRGTTLFIQVPLSGSNTRQG